MTIVAHHLLMDDPEAEKPSNISSSVSSNSLQPSFSTTATTTSSPTTYTTTTTTTITAMNPSTVVMFSPRNLAQTFNKNNDSKSCKNNSNTSIMDACAITEASSTTCGEEEEDDDDHYDQDEEHEIVSYSRSTVEEHPLINDNIKICVPIAAAVDDYYEEEKGSCLSLPAVPIPTLETDNQQVQSLDLKQILQEMDAELDDLITKTKSTIEKSTTTASTALSCSFNSSKFNFKNNKFSSCAKKMLRYGNIFGNYNRHHS